MGLAACTMLIGCTYHGRVRRGIYVQPAQDDRVVARVLVVSDKHIPEQISLVEPESSQLYAFDIETADGTAVAAADALGTLFTQVDAGLQRLENEYDLVAEVTLESGLTRSNCEGSLDKWAVRVTGLCTQVTVSVRRPQTADPVAVYTVRRWKELHKPGFPTALQWLNKHTFSIFSPVLLPLYTQTQGAELRRQLEEHLREILQEIMEQLGTRKAEFRRVLGTRPPVS